MISGTETKKFAIAHVGPEGRVALCEILGDVIEAESWKEARRRVDKATFKDRPGYAGAHVTQK